MSDKKQLNDAMWNAAKNGQDKEVCSLIQRGADPNYMPRYYRAALHVAAHEGHVNVLQGLIHSGCNINIKSYLPPPLLEYEHNASGLHWAAFGGQVEAFIFLLSNGIDPEMKNGENKTAFEYGNDQFRETVFQRQNEMARNAGAFAAEGADGKSNASHNRDVSERIDAIKSEPEGQGGSSADVAYWHGCLEAAQASFAAAGSHQASIQGELRRNTEMAGASREAVAASESEVGRLRQELKEAELRSEQNKRLMQLAEKAKSISVEKLKEASLKLDKAHKDVERCKGEHKNASERLHRLCEAAATRQLATFDEAVVAEFLKEIGLPAEVQSLFKQNCILGKHLESICCDTDIMDSMGIKGLYDRKRLRHAITMVTTCGVVKVSSAVLEEVATETGDEVLKRACWSVDEVAKWLQSNGVEEQVCQKARQTGLIGEVLIHFEWKDFKELGVGVMGTCLTLQQEMIATKSALFKAMGERIIKRHAVGGSEAPQASNLQQARSTSRVRCTI